MSKIYPIAIDGANYEVTVSAGLVFMPTTLAAQYITAGSTADGTFATSDLYTFKEDLDVGGDIGVTGSVTCDDLGAGGKLDVVENLIFNSAASIEHGTGSPEGVVTAEPGSIYLNESGGSGVSIYMKESGTGNTGWATIGGNTLKYGIDISAGNIPGESAVNKFGINTEIDSGVPEDIWSAGGTYTWPAAAAVCSITSGSANDAIAGTGARTVQVWGLDASYADQTEVVDMAGAGGVNTSNTYIRMFRMKVLTAGSGGTAAGKITSTLSGSVVAEIPLGYNQTEMALYTIPAGKTGYVHSLTVSGTDSATRADMGAVFKVREFGGVFATKHDVRLATDGSCTATKYFDLPLKVTEKSDMIMTGSSNRDDTFFAAAFDIILKDN